jgi:predicted transposase/invertase (TIGR01784 family)
MAQDYDKIFKENIEEIILPLAEKILNIKPEKLEEIPDDLQKTIERKPDFLKKMLYSDKSKDFILHIEFQKEDNQEMVYRMYEYHALLLRKYKMKILQCVFYIDQAAPQMLTHLEFDNLNFSFQLYHFQDFDYHTFLNSNEPEEVILAILANFGGENPEKVAEKILNKLKSLPTETFRHEKCVKQLEILSKLRNLQGTIIKLLEQMALTYDLKEDLRYQQGISEGIKEGKKETIIETIEKMLKDKILSYQKIAQYFDVSVEFVQEIANKMKK